MPSFLCPRPLSFSAFTLLEEQESHAIGRRPGKTFSSLVTLPFCCNYSRKSCGEVKERRFRRIWRLAIRNEAVINGRVFESCDLSERNDGDRVFNLVQRRDDATAESPGLVGECGEVVDGCKGIIVSEKETDGGIVEDLKLVEESSLLSSNGSRKSSCTNENFLKAYKVVEFIREQIVGLDSDGISGTQSSGRIVNVIRNFLAVNNIKTFPNSYEDKPLAISVLNDLLISFIKSEQLELAISVFYALPSLGLPPDSLSFSIMIQCLCKRKEPDNAKLVLHEMLRNGYHPNTITFTVLVNSLCKRGKVKKALEVFEKMGEIGCEPTIQTYNCLLNGLCYVGRVEESYQLLRKIQKSSMKPDIYTYTTVMDGFCKVGRSNEAMELLDEAMKSGLKPNVVTLNSLLNGYSKEGRPLEGVALLKKMVDRDCQPDIISYTILLQGLLRWGQNHAALGIYKDMVRLDFRADERIMNTLLRGICRESIINNEKLIEAKELFEKILGMGYNVSPYTYSLMIQALARCGEIDMAFSHLLEMVRIGYTPRLMTYNVVIRLLCRDGRIDDAFLVFLLMIKSDIISPFSCTILIDEFNQRGRILDACGVYGLALKQGVFISRKPNSSTKLNGSPTKF